MSNKEELDDPIKDWMSLKDYFAAQAIDLFSLSDEELDQIKNKGYAPNHKFVAKFCYDLAEEMLRERMRRDECI